jgi:PAS domain S-box-containing protein
LHNANESQSSSGALIAARVLDDMADGVLAIDLSGQIILFNPAAARILGMAQDLALGQPFASLFIEEAANDDFNQLILDAVYESSTSHNRVVAFVKPQAAISLVLTTSFLKQDGAAGQRIGVIAVFSDITELQALQAEQTRMAQALQTQHAQLQAAYLKTEEANTELQAAVKRIQVIRNTATALSLSLFLGVGVYLWNPRMPSSPAVLPVAAESAGMAQELVTLTPQRITSSIALSGKLQPLQTVSVSSPIAGKLSKVLVNLGDVVTTGQTLVEMDTLEAGIRQRELQVAYIKALSAFQQVEKWSDSPDMARANRSVARAKVALENQKKNLDESARLFQKGIIPATEHESARQMLENQQMDYQSAQEELRATQERGNPAALEALRHEVDNARTRLQQIERDLAAAKVLAPVGGIVFKAGGKDDKALERGASFSQGAVLLSIGDLSGFSVKAKVDEVDVTRVRAGQRVMVKGEAFAGEAMEGVLQSISPLADDREGSGSAAAFGIRVVINSVPPALRERVLVGMSTHLDIMIYDNAQALMLPIRAVQEELSKRYVQLKTASGLVRSEVKTGYTTADSVEITQGLKAGDQVQVPR